MSEEYLNKRISQLEADLKAANAEAAKFRVRAKKFKEEGEKALTDKATELEKAQQKAADLKKALDQKPDPETEVEGLRNQVRAFKNEKAFESVKGELHEKVALDKFWAEVGYTPGDEPPTPDQIKELVGRAREAAPYLFRPESPADSSSPPGGAPAQPLPPGPGLRRGSPDGSFGSLTQQVDAAFASSGRTDPFRI